MKKIVGNEKMVDLENYFEGVWASLWRIGKDVALETDELKTPFVVRASMAKRVGCKTREEVIVFLRLTQDERLNECSRCYADCWGHYFNCFGKEGQRIEMYCKAIDYWVTQNALT